MELVALILACVAVFFSVCAFIASAATAVIVLGWKNSTHKVVQLPAVLPETREAFDIPFDVLNPTPDSPTQRTPEEYLIQKRREAEDMDALYEPNF